MISLRTVPRLFWFADHDLERAFVLQFGVRPGEAYAERGHQEEDRPAARRQRGGGDDEGYPRGTPTSALRRDGGGERTDLLGNSGLSLVSSAGQVVDVVLGF